jgi:hypothetical protein
MFMHWLDEERARRTRGMWQRLLLHQGSDKRKKSLMRGKDRGDILSITARKGIAYYRQTG